MLEAGLVFGSGRQMAGALASKGSPSEEVTCYNLIPWLDA